jgi:hypothetical protein
MSSSDPDSELSLILILSSLILILSPTDELTDPDSELAAATPGDLNLPSLLEPDLEPCLAHHGVLGPGPPLARGLLPHGPDIHEPPQPLLGIAALPRAPLGEGPHLGGMGVAVCGSVCVCVTVCV